METTINQKEKSKSYYAEYYKNNRERILKQNRDRRRRNAPREEDVPKTVKRKKKAEAGNKPLRLTTIKIGTTVLASVKITPKGRLVALEHFKVAPRDEVYFPITTSDSEILQWVSEKFIKYAEEVRVIRESLSENMKVVPYSVDTVPREILDEEIQMDDRRFTIKGIASSGLICCEIVTTGLGAPAIMTFDYEVLSKRARFKRTDRPVGVIDTGMVVKTREVKGGKHG